MDTQGQILISAIKAARAALGWSQDDLAQRSGTALVTIARMEAGSVSPRLSTVTRLKQTLEVAGLRIIDGSPQGGFTVVAERTAFTSSEAIDLPVKRLQLMNKPVSHQTPGRSRRTKSAATPTR